MEQALDNLRPTDDAALKYARIASTAPEEGDREATMDVADELNGNLLDALQELARSYRLVGCLDHAKQIGR